MDVLLYGKSKAIAGLGGMLKSSFNVSSVHIFEELSQVIEYNESNHAELLILDADDADISWRYLVKKFKKIDEQMKIVLISADNNKAVTAYETGVFDYLLKPVKISQLERIIEKAADCSV